MDHDEIVESSDREEVESIQAGDVEYWSRAIALAAVTHVQPVSSVMGYGAHDGPAEGPPFKRMKLSPSPDTILRRTPSPSFPLRSPGSWPLATRTTSLPPEIFMEGTPPQNLVLMRSSSPESSIPIPTPQLSAEHDPLITAGHDIMEKSAHSGGGSLVSTVQNHPRRFTNLPSRFTTPSSFDSFDLSIPGDETSVSSSHSPYMERHPLFIPQNPQISDSEERCTSTPFRIIEGNNPTHSTPRSGISPTTNAVPLSPLTPLSSPRKRAPKQILPTAVQSPSVLQDASPVSPHTAEGGNGPEDDMIAQELAQASNRYALRTRQARQVNPYAYDRLMYKRQMRSNPDAIVKVVSPPRPRRQYGSPRSGREDGDDGGMDTGDEYEYAGGEEEEEEEWRRRRRKEKSRSISVGEMEHGNEEQRSRSKGKSRSVGVEDQVHAVSDAEQNAGTSNANFSRRPERREAWYPGAFDEPFSSSNEDDLPGPPLPAEKKARPADEHEVGPSFKPKPFPMKRKDFKRRSPKKRHDSTVALGERALSLDVDAVGISDEDGEASVVRWRRQKSSTLSVHSPVRSSSPTRMRATQEDAPVFDDDNDLFNNFGSPLLVPSTPTDNDLSMSQTDLAQDRLPIQNPDSDVEILPGNPYTPSERSRSPGQGSDSESSSSIEMTAKDRRRLKALRRMMPGVLIRQHLKAGNTKPRRRASSSVDSRTDSDDGETPLRPGQSKIHIGNRAGRSSIEIRGDSESSDIEMLGAAPTASSSSSEASSNSEMNVVSGLSRPRKYIVRYHHASGLNGDENVLLDDDSDDVKVGQWLSEKVVYNRRASKGPRDEAKEGDLIDRMLSRTRIGGPRVKKVRLKRNATGVGRRSKLSSGESVHIVTAGARKNGPERQTLLPFSRRTSSADRSRNVETTEGDKQIHVPSPQMLDKYYVQADEPSAKANNKQRKRKMLNNTVGLYTFAPAGDRLATGRSSNLPVTIDEESVARFMPQDDAEQGPTGPRRRLNPQSRRSLTPDELTLHDYWSFTGDAVEREQLSRVPAHDEELLLSHRVTVDFGIPFLPSGIAFGPGTCIGHGWLHELVLLFSDHQDILHPTPCYLFEVQLQPAMSVQDLSISLEKVNDKVYDLITQRRDTEIDDCQQWQMLLHSISQHISWLLHKSEEEDYVSLHTAIEKHIHRINAYLEESAEIIPEDEPPNYLAFELRWYVIELLCRIECHRRQRHGQVNDTFIRMHVRQLMRQLWDHGFQKTMETFFDTEQQVLDGTTISQRAAELWVCLIYVINSLALSMPAGTIDQFWAVYIQFIRDESLLLRAASELVVSETIWGSLFSLCALSQFSVHGMSTSTPRLPACWQLVTIALERVRLASERASDATLTKRGLRKRDEYIRLLISRCLILNHRWHWQLDDASGLFNRLLDIFKSRLFANLSDEPPDFPSFLRHNNLQLLSENKRSDTAFTLFLKLIVQAAKDGSKQHEGRQAATMSSKIKKLLSLCVPVGSVPFTKATPPTDQELSMLYNRFSAVAIAIYLEPVMANLKYRIANARRYVNFKDTDNETRRACIRGLMHLAILLRHLHLPLDDILDWLSDMTNILIDEYCEGGLAGHAKNWIIICIQMLLGCVRRIIETPLMDPGETVAQYPDPMLLQGPWVTRLFSTSTNLTSVVTTRLEIRRLVQAFLDARSTVVPKPPRPRHSAVTEDSQDSQEDYGPFDPINLDDPELLAALGEPVESLQVQENKHKEKLVCEIIDAHISPAIYRLVCKHFNDIKDQGTIEQSSQDADRWIDCWVGCASIVVQNGKRDWSLYLTLGPQSWERIIDTTWRRRVGLRFMFMLLQLDPSAYPTFTDRFLDILMESIVTPRVTLEHEYASLVFSIDGLRHRFLHDIPCEKQEGSADFQLSRKDFLEARLSILERMFANLADTLSKEAAGEVALTAHNQTCLGFMVTMLSTMQDTHQQFAAESEERAKYMSFCQQVYNHLSQFAILKTHSRLHYLVKWASTLT
ncbi:hypothetical protein AcW2_007217 [Taiwanofungus camphoratus]|nr:hypothetical protein AcW2_007217 [Antrodia cinnamomea]